MTKAEQNLQRSTLQKLMLTDTNPLIPLRIDYSLDNRLLTGTINKLVGVDRIYPTHLPTQASFRWSTLNPAITNWPRACINQSCPRAEHEWSEGCWSVRDILKADSDEVLISWDHDNIEGKIHDLIVADEEGITAHANNQDLHTIRCCQMFGYNMPQNLINPHTFCECDDIIKELQHTYPHDKSIARCVHCQWRQRYKWQGKDTKQRVLAKNFNHGSKYTKTWRFVYKIEGIERYGVSRNHLGDLAKRYIASKNDAWQRKLHIMANIQSQRWARTLYGGRRLFFDSSEETGREGFSHMISGTVSDYNNMTLILLERWLGDDIRLLHNAHDGDKVAIKRKDFIAESKEFMIFLRKIIERPIAYNNRSLIMTAGIKVHNS